MTKLRKKKMTIEVDVQRACEFPSLPGDEQFAAWAVAVLADRQDTELTVRLVGREESRDLNERFRGKDRPTNVLSFPAGLPEGLGISLLGDVVICAPVVAEEAEEQGKTLADHLAHLTVHGILHLLGYDHQQEADAERMEQREVEILATLGVADPYRENRPESAGN
jgi:probable rRNA maturation factor